MLVFLAAGIAYAYHLGWHLFIWRHKVRAGIIAKPSLVVMLWLGWSLGSPLFTNTTVDEEFPFAVTATVPRDMDIEAVEAVMAGMAKVESAVSEDMPVMLAKATVNSLGTPATAAASSAESPTAAPTEPPVAVEPVILKSGEFQDIDGFHKGTGAATIYRGPDGTLLLRFEDFKVTNGPELHVVLSPYGGPDEVGGRLMSIG